MASTYTNSQRLAACNTRIYDYFFEKYKPEGVAYRDKFFIHLGTNSGKSLWATKAPGAICINYDKGYFNASNGYGASNGYKSLCYAIRDFNTTFGLETYSYDDAKDMPLLYAEICDVMGYLPDVDIKNVSAPNSASHRKAKNLLETYQEERLRMIDKPDVEVPRQLFDKQNKIINYMKGRGIDENVTKDLMKANLLYLGETRFPYYEIEKDAEGNFVKDKSGSFVYKRDENFQKVPQTYVKDGVTKIKYRYGDPNMVFITKNQEKETMFLEKKPFPKPENNSKAFIAANASSFGYFSFTGGLEDFKQLPPPEETGKPMKAYICEAPIDAISLYVLHQKMGITEPAEYISISGVGKNTAIQRAICEGYDCILAFDNDPKGREAMDARRMVAFIDPVTNKEVALPSITPLTIEFDRTVYNPQTKSNEIKHTKVKDWNDMLIAMVEGKNHTFGASKKEMSPQEAMSNPVCSTPMLRYDPSTTKGFRKNPCPKIEPRVFVEARDYSKSTDTLNKTNAILKEQKDKCTDVTI